MNGYTERQQSTPRAESRQHGRIYPSAQRERSSYDNATIEMAERYTLALTDCLLQDLGRKQRRYMNLGVVTSDVEDSIQRLDIELLLLAKIGRPFPCLVPSSGEFPIPLDFLPDQFYWAPPQSAEAYSLYYQLHTHSRKNLEQRLGSHMIQDFSHQDVVAFFRARLQNFLTIRFASGNLRPEDTFRPSPGIRVQVETKIHGYRIYYSKSISLNFYVFGAPSTPVMSWLQPGDYIFGFGFPGEPPRFDRNAIWEISCEKNHVDLGV